MVDPAQIIVTGTSDPNYLTTVDAAILAKNSEKV